jgi:hypothetical protein
MEGVELALKKRGYPAPMSALPPKADIRHRDGHVRFVPKADIRIAAKKNPLFDHLVGGGEQFGWDVEAECPGGIEVDYKFKLR